MSGDMHYIQHRYGAHIRVGARVRYVGGLTRAGMSDTGTIVGYSDAYLRIRFDGDEGPHHCNFHPTWNLEYLDAPSTDATPMTVVGGADA